VTDRLLALRALLAHYNRIPLTARTLRLRAEIVRELSALESA